MLHHRRHVVHRNTFRCTCCCCSQITKYQTHYVPPWRAQGIGLTRVGGFLWARHSGTHRAATLAHATPSTTCGTSKHLPLHVLLLFSNYQVPNSLRTAVARPGNRANARWGIPLGATQWYTSCSHPCPCYTIDDMWYIETPSVARVAVVLKLPSTKLITYRRGAPRESG